MSNCQPNCGCKFEVDSSCVRYTSGNLGTTSINTGDTVETTIIKIDAAINNLNQQFASSQTSGIEGPINKVAKFGPPSTPLIASQTEDNGTSIGVNAPANSSFKMYVETSPNQSGLKIESLNNGKDAIIASLNAPGSTINRASYALASGSTTGNIGSESLASGSAQLNIGIVSRAIGGNQNFSAQLRDGSETVQGGKFLKDTGDGKANWNYIYLADIQDYQAPVPFVLQPATSSVLGGVKIGSGINITQDGTISVTPTAQYSLPTASSTVLGGIKVGNGLAISGQGVLSANIGQGTINYVAKFTPDGYSIDDSLIQDNGTTIGIGVSPSSDEFIKSVSSKPTCGYFKSTAASSENFGIQGIGGESSVYTNYGVYGSSTSTSGGLNVGIRGYATGSNSPCGVQGTAGGGSSSVGIKGNASAQTTAIGVEGNANAGSSKYGGVFTAQGSGLLNVGMQAYATGGTSNYSVVLQDGTETTQGGKFLRDMGNGKANWATIDFNPQKTITASYTLTSADNGYSIIVANGATAVTITIPAGLPTSMQVGFIQDGSADVTFATASGVSLNCAVAGATKIKTQYEQAYLEKKGTAEVYYLLGNVKV